MSYEYDLFFIDKSRPDVLLQREIDPFQAGRNKIYGNYDQLSRKFKLKTFCLKFDKRSFQLEMLNELIYSDKKKVVYCRIPKAASTNWKRVLQVIENNNSSPKIWNNRETVHKLNFNTFNKLDVDTKYVKMKNYFKFLFVRHPFERLISAYRNKFLDPYDNYYRLKIGKRILKFSRNKTRRIDYIQGKGVTFKEFITYIIHQYQTQGTDAFDVHWQLMVNLCSPCHIHYDFIGKLETLAEDSERVMKHVTVSNRNIFPLNMPDKYKRKTKDLMKEMFSGFSNETLTVLYQIYKEDFKAFDYKLPYHLAPFVKKSEEKQNLERLTSNKKPQR